MIYLIEKVATYISHGPLRDNSPSTSPSLRRPCLGTATAKSQDFFWNNWRMSLNITEIKSSKDSWQNVTVSCGKLNRFDRNIPPSKPPGFARLRIWNCLKPLHSHHAPRLCVAMAPTTGSTWWLISSFWSFLSIEETMWHHIKGWICWILVFEYCENISIWVHCLPMVAWSFEYVEIRLIEVLLVSSNGYQWGLVIEPIGVTSPFKAHPLPIFFRRLLLASRASVSRPGFFATIGFALAVLNSCTVACFGRNEKTVCRTLNSHSLNKCPSSWVTNAMDISNAPNKFWVQKTSTTRPSIVTSNGFLYTPGLVGPGTLPGTARTALTRKRPGSMPAALAAAWMNWAEKASWSPQKIGRSVFCCLLCPAFFFQEWNSKNMWKHVKHVDADRVHVQKLEDFGPRLRICDLERLLDLNGCHLE